MDAPEIRYAKTKDGAHIAYTVAGEGPPDLVYVPGWNSRLDLSWEHPLDARFLRSLASFSRLIVVDRRGSGVSDSVTHGAAPPLEVLVDDITSVLEAVGSGSAALFGEFEGGPLCALFAATYPARTQALILYGTYARGAWAPDYPWAWTDEELETDIAHAELAIESGTDEEYFVRWAEEMIPTLALDPSIRPYLRKLYGLTNPGSTIALSRFEHALDIRTILPTIGVPTLVMNRTDDRVASVDEGRWLASQIPGAKFEELSGVDHPPWAGDQDAILESISGFLGAPKPTRDIDRVLKTVLFTDIVNSTQKASELGDERWKHLLTIHDQRARAEITRYSGTFVDSAGDGIFATFDGPAKAVRCAQSLGRSLREVGLEIRAGCHTGEVELVPGNVRGMGVHIGARIAAHAEASEILVSSTVKDLVAGSGLVFEDAGEHERKGVPDQWHLYRVVGEPA